MRQIELGLIGYPLTHSFSATYFHNKFLQEGLRQQFSYRNFEIRSVTELPDLIRNNSRLTGLNVTIPYKQAVIPYLDELSVESQEIGAVNTILIHRDPSGHPIRLSGDNTDWIGFQKSLTAAHAPVPWPARALILGTGGASKAVEYVLKKLGINTLHVSRQPENHGVNTISYPDLTPVIVASCQLIINTTPLGMFPAVNACPDIPYKAIGHQHFLYDLIYNPEETLFLSRGREQGARICNGQQMLIEQAEASWIKWFNATRIR